MEEWAGAGRSGTGRVYLTTDTWLIPFHHTSASRNSRLSFNLVIKHKLFQLWLGGLGAVAGSLTPTAQRIAKVATGVVHASNSGGFGLLLFPNYFLIISYSISYSYYLFIFPKDCLLPILFVLKRKKHSLPF